MYQIPNFDEESALGLAECVLERYKYELVETVVKCLEQPPHTGEKNWRLTPDTISDWMDITLDKQSELREREISMQKAKNAEIMTVEFTVNEDLKPETKKMIQDYLDSLSGPKMVQAMTDKDVRKFGGERPYKSNLPYQSTSEEYLIEKELRRRWALEVHDKYTGKRLENWLSFEEWKLI
jgi:hypothetical protein